MGKSAPHGHLYRPGIALRTTDVTVQIVGLCALFFWSYDFVFLLTARGLTKQFVFLFTTTNCPACLGFQTQIPLSPKRKMRSHLRLIHRRDPKNPETTFQTMFNFQTGRVVLRTVLYRPSSRPLASVSLVSPVYWLMFAR